MGLKLFYEYFNRIEVRIFCLKNVVPTKFVICYKIDTIEKNTFFDTVFSILVLPEFKNREEYFLKKKKHAPRFVSSGHKKISA